MSDEELNYAAGIIPYVIDCDQEISFLLGYENNKWSGFVGKYENCDNLNIINTAVREFNEETAYTFNGYIDIIKNKIIHDDCFFIKTKSMSKRRIIYIYFVKLDLLVLDTPFETIFLENLKNTELLACKEKSQIKWIKYRELHNFDLLPGLKKILLYNISKY